MSNDFLIKLEKRFDAGLKVKPIFKDEEKNISVLKFLKNQNFLNFKEVLKILKINFNHKKPIGYILLKDENKIVGFLGTIFCKRPIKEQLVEHCYLHSWIVSKNHRLEAFKLIIPVIKQNIFISTYSPTKSLEGLYKKLGFEEIQFFSKIVLSFSFFNFKKNNVHMNEEKFFFEKYIKEDEKILLKDHALTDTRKIFIYFDNNKNNNIFIIVKKKFKNFFFPILDIIHISNFKKFKSYEEEIGFELFKKFKTIFFKVNILEKNDIFLKPFFLQKIVKKKAYYYNKPINFEFDVLYSELLR
jgi:hypothetical protein